MADIQLIIAADVKEVNTAINSVNKLEKQARQAAKAFATGKISQDKYNQALRDTTRAYTQYAKNRQKASADVRKFAREEIALHQQVAKAAEQKEWFAAQRRKLAMMKESERMAQQQVAQEQRQAQQSAKATQQKEAALERLKLQYNQTYAAASSFKKQLGDLNTLHKAGGLSSEQHKLKVKALKDEYRAFLNGSATPMNQFVQGQNLMTKGANRSGMAVQQMGYQVGDFLVQVQSGTNWMVAFGQQATQLVGVLPMVAGGFGLTVKSAIALSTGLGIVIPLVTALGAAWMRTRDANKEAAESTDLLEGKIKSLDSTIQEFILTRRAAEAGVTVDEFLGTEGIEEAERNLARLREQLENITSVTDQGAKTGNILLRFFGFAADTYEATKLTAAVEEISAAEERLANIRRMQSAKRLAFVAEERQALQDQLRINELILEHGEDSIEVARERVAQERRMYEETLRRNEVGEATIASLLEQFDVVNEMRLEIERSSKAAGDLSNLINSIGFDRALAGAEELGRRLSGVLSTANNILQVTGRAGQQRLDEREELRLAQMEVAGREQGMSDADVARMIARERERTRLTQEYGSAAGAMTSIIEAQAYRAGQTAYQMSLTQDQLSVLRRPAQDDDDDEAPLSAATDDYLQRLLQEAEYKRSLVDLSDEEARIQEILFGLGRQIQEGDMKRIQQIVETEQETQELIAAEEKRKSQLEQLTSDFESMFESIITGSQSAGEAIKDTFRKILLDIYKQQVISPMADTVSGFIRGIFQANGGAWNNGVQMFANGGTFTNSVVSKPTAFSHAGGLGVMGEAGPEAIMPLKRMANGKLGVESNSNGGSSNSSIVVHQSFNFSANGDDSVKRIIAQAAPQIAQMTQKQIMESRRRGGQMKATFS